MTSTGDNESGTLTLGWTGSADITTDYAIFSGSFSCGKLIGGDELTLYLGSDNKLYYPSVDMSVGAFRAIFQLQGLDNDSKAIHFDLNFSDDATSIVSPVRDREVDAWYSLDGRRLNGQPMQRGLYIHRGKKVIVK